MKLFIALLLTLSFVACQSAPPVPVINTPAPMVGRKPVYVSTELYEDIKAQIPDFPKKGSAAQSIDEFALRKIQKSVLLLQRSDTPELVGIRDTPHHEQHVDLLPGGRIQVLESGL